MRKIDFRRPVSSPGLGITTALREWRAMASRGPSKRRGKKDRMPRRLFKEKHNPPTISPGVQILRDPPGHEKMSEVLEDFIKPYESLGDSEEAMRKLLSLGMLAWNAAILPEDKGRALIAKTLGSALGGVSKEDWARGMEFVEILVRRKQEHFAANQRLILSFEFTFTGDDYHLSVMSTL
jgi:hypothetical protein